MKKFLVIISIFIVSNLVKAQFILEENFNYPPGLLYAVSEGLWTRTNNNDSRIVEGNLIYPKYKSSEIGRRLSLGIIGKGDITRNLDSVLTKTVYISLLLSLKDTLDLSATGATFFYLGDHNFGAVGFLCLKKSLNPGIVNIGFYKTTSSKTIFSAKDIYPLQTYLIVFKYEFRSGSTSNDILSIFVNPELTQNEPLPDAFIDNDNDILNINKIIFRQSSQSGNMFIDGLRVSTRWADAPLPVELSAFSAVQNGDNVILNWKTETELDNHGFEVERRLMGDEWKTLSFLQGYGNSYSPRYYSFTDTDVKYFTEYFYRLKQIDNDGSFTYSGEVNIKINAGKEFQLYQNYPNPFNPVTTIKFFMAESGDAVLTLYNAIGQKIKNIVNESFSAGEHKVELDGSSLQSGVYFCVFEAGGNRKTIKLTFMK